jgi:rhodanese-related sulfurtransferase
MIAWAVNLTLNQKLATAALLLGAVGAFARVAPDHVVAVHERELLTSVERQDDHLMATELAGWIVEGRSNYRLIDLRDEKAYGEYHLPTAENVPLAMLPDAALLRNETIVLYSEGGIHAAQAWMLLRAKGYAGATTLRGGLDAWKEEVLFPALPKDPTPQDQARFERAAAVAKFFGGSPRSGAADSAVLATPELPKVAAPAPTGAGAPGGAPRKKKEGC